MSSHHTSTSTQRPSFYTTNTPPHGLGGASTKETLNAYIQRACDPLLHEPNMSLNLEISDLINTKKANTPREAAVATIGLVNSRNTHTAMLALHLLDILVKNCGYPFHLQISTKDFLNELVRRFPERPPTFPPPPMAKILELIHEWKNTLCVHSKYKEDLIHIRDMHRLLSYKGYRFPDYDKRAASVLNPSESLQTPDELEEEDRAAQAAKLQELIRRGTPKDLAAAQELMKVMAGAEPDKKPNYEQQVAKELDRIQSRILLLNEMLNNMKPKERFADGDAFAQIANKCRQVQPKIQKWIEESAENDPGNMDRLLSMNDLINNVVNRYEAFKNGDRNATADIDSTFTTKAGGAAKPKPNQVSLIDFDFDDAPAPATTPGGSSTPAAATNPMDDLSALASLDLSGSVGSSNGNGYGQSSANRPQQVDPMAFFKSSSGPSTSSAYFSSNANNVNQNLSWGNAPSPSATPSPGFGNGISLGGQQPAQSQGSPVPPQVPDKSPKVKDPFGDLLGDF